MNTTNQAINYPPENKNAVENVIELIGNTPLIKLSNFTKELNPNVEVYIKAEWFNPGGSVKDRPALKMILDGISTGKLTKDKVIMDSSSGNTAIAFAMIGAALGYKAELVIPENVNVERKKILIAFGADILYSDPLESSDGAIRLARKLLKENPEKYFSRVNLNPPLRYDSAVIPDYIPVKILKSHFDYDPREIARLNIDSRGRAHESLPPPSRNHGDRSPQISLRPSRADHQRWTRGSLTPSHCPGI